MNKKLRKQLTPLYEQIGAVVQGSQQMEFTISLCLTFLKRLGSKAFGDNAFNDSMDFFSSKTLGTLLKELKKHIDLDAAAINALELALNERNYVIHKFFSENIERFINKEGRDWCLNRIRKARHNINPGFLILDSAAQNLMRVSGIDPNQVIKKVNSTIEI